MQSPASEIQRYHDGTKHHFARFARSLGYLDWASQPRPFRTFSGAPTFPLFPSPTGVGDAPPPPAVSYGDVLAGRAAPQPLTAVSVGDLLRHALGLSAWKQFDKSRWSLRVNPSSGNLHPTEAYIVCGPMAGLCDDGGVFHYAADTHALERRCQFHFPVPALPASGALLLALTSIHWREAWKYGERAFRYCQHDLGHAAAAVALAAASLGWRVEMVSEWSQLEIGGLIGLDRDDDYVDAEREEPGCVLAITAVGSAHDVMAHLAGGAPELVAAVRAGQWTGHASQLSEDHMQWTFIDEIASASSDPGHRVDPRPSLPSPPAADTSPAVDARRLFLQRRSAVSFDGRPRLSRDVFFGMLSRVMPSAQAPWSMLWWRPRIHLLVFVHRVDDVEPGLYVLGRDAEGLVRLRGAIRRELPLEPAHATLPFLCLARGDCRSMARRLSCDQDIAADGFFSLGMIAEFDASLAEHGPSFYRHLFWESGVVGQMLYLEAEAAGVRGTGIGCFYDDPVHDVLGLEGHAFQSLYHFTIGAPVEDRRLTTEPGYEWER